MLVSIETLLGDLILQPRWITNTLLRTLLLMINKELPRIFTVPLGGSVRASPTVHKAFHRLVLEHYSWAKQPTDAWGNGKNVPMCVTPISHYRGCRSKPTGNKQCWAYLDNRPSCQVIVCTFVDVVVCCWYFYQCQPQIKLIHPIIG